MSEDLMPNAPRSIDDLSVAMELKGKVKRLELYGAFVDIGVGQDGLLHISQLGKPNVRNVEDVLSVDDEITVYILKVHKENNRIALSMEKPPAVDWNTLKEGETFDGRIVRIENFGVFVDIGAERPGMVHVSELTDGFVKSPSDVVSLGQEVKVRVLKVDARKRQIDLSMKEPAEEVYQIEEEEDAAEIPTAMELAFRKARQDKRKNKGDAREQAKRHRREQDDIISRTLRDHSSN